MKKLVRFLQEPTTEYHLIMIFLMIAVGGNFVNHLWGQLVVASLLTFTGLLYSFNSGFMLEKEKSNPFQKGLNSFLFFCILFGSTLNFNLIVHQLVCFFVLDTPNYLVTEKYLNTVPSATKNLILLIVILSFFGWLTLCQFLRNQGKKSFQKITPGAG